MTLAEDGHMTKSGPMITVVKGSGALFGLSWVTYATIAYD